MSSIGSRLKHAWNAFSDPKTPASTSNAWQTGVTSYYGVQPDRIIRRASNERSIIASMYTRMALDIAAVQIRHVRLDANDRYLEDINSGLNSCLTLEANIDQAARAFRQDIALSLFEKGVIALVPVDTTLNPQTSGGYDIRTLRIGEIVQWYPDSVKVNLYNDRTGLREDLILKKSMVAIIENPLYMLMNEPNSTLQRLLRKLALLDVVDEQSSSGKLDIIIQVPYVVKSEARRTQAEQRRDDIAFQLKGSQYGIAYTDGTEKITQLNRPAENNLLKQVEYLMALLYTQLGFTAEIMNGTANEAAMLNYVNRTIDPFLGAIVEAMKRSFLTSTARTQKQSIEYFKNPFNLIPLNNIAEIADKFTRNEILSSNEVRQIIGFKPSSDPKAEALRNSNMPQSELGVTAPEAVDSNAPGSTTEDSTDNVDAMMQDAFDEIDNTLNSIFADLGIDEDASE
jgi:hypothetical protein